MGCSSMASPLCTWIVASFVSADAKQSPAAAAAAGRRRRRVAGLSTVRELKCGLISAFEPCEEFYNSSTNGLLFGNGSGVASRRQRRAAQSCSNSGKVMAVAVQPAEEITERKIRHTKERRVVVTGMGVVTPLGDDPDVFYNNLLEGASGISEIETFDCAAYPTRIAGEIKSFSTDGWVAAKLSKRMDKFMLYLLTAGKKALANGGMSEEIMNQLDKAKCGVLIGSAMGGMKITLCSQFFIHWCTLRCLMMQLKR